jgi:CRISPR-associated protein Cas2
MVLSGYKAMWILVLFDLPTRKKKQRKRATQFRKILLEDGFDMMQYSVYLRPCPSEENTDVHFERVKRALPPEGHVRIFKITDKQFERMHCFRSGEVSDLEVMPEQLGLF